MITYFKSNNPEFSPIYFAVAGAKTYAPKDAKRVNSTPSLRSMADRKSIPTYRVLSDGKLGAL